jgi:hypothetical protein
MHSVTRPDLLCFHARRPLPSILENPKPSHPSLSLSKPLNSSVSGNLSKSPYTTRLSLDLSGLSLALLVGHDDVVHVLGPGDLGTGGGEDDLDVTRVSLVRVDSTVGSVSPSSGFLSGSNKVEPSVSDSVVLDA